MKKINEVGPSIGVVIYTFNRVDDARINMELIHSWNSSYFSSVKIAHAYNGDKAWYSKQNEEYFIQRKNLGHQKGAADLIDSGIEAFLKKENIPEYIIVLAADTWLIKPDYIEKIIKKMKKEKLVLSTSSWGSNKSTSLWQSGLATDFFIFETAFAKKNKLFPLSYEKFSAKFKEVLDYLSRNTILEHLFSVRYLQALERAFYIPGDHLRRMVAQKMMYRMKEREPVHKETLKIYERNMKYQKIHLYTHHDPKEKQKLLRKYGAKSPYAKKLMETKDLNYYNAGHVKNELTLPNGKIISMH